MDESRVRGVTLPFGGREQRVHVPAAHELRDRFHLRALRFGGRVLPVLPDVIAHDQPAAGPEDPGGLCEEALGGRTVHERLDGVREVRGSDIGGQCAVVTFMDANAMRQPERRDALVAQSRLNGTERDANTREVPPLREVRQAGADATAKIDDLRRPIESERVNLAGDQIFDITEGLFTGDHTRAPDRAMDGAESAPLAVPDERIGVGVVVGAHICGRECRFGQRVKVQ